jgi:hypothetical protein
MGALAQATRVAADIALSVAADRANASLELVKSAHNEVRDALMAAFKIAETVLALMKASAPALEALMTQLSLAITATLSIEQASEHLQTTVLLTAKPMEVHGFLVQDGRDGARLVGSWLAQAQAPVGHPLISARDNNGRRALLEPTELLHRDMLSKSEGRCRKLLRQELLERSQERRRDLLAQTKLLLRDGGSKRWRDWYYHLCSYGQEAAQGTLGTSRTRFGWQWEADDEASACKGRSREFDLVRRKHHYRLCGRVFCGTCAPRRYALPLSRPLARARALSRSLSGSVSLVRTRLLCASARCVCLRHSSSGARGVGVRVATPPRPPGACLHFAGAVGSAGPCAASLPTRARLSLAR